MDTSTKNFRQYREVLIISGVIIYLALRLAYFATHIHPEIPPDETTHYGKSVAFSHALFIPENGPDTYEFGLMTNLPYLYYWVMGKCLHLNSFSINDLVFLRLANGLIGVICAVFVYKWARLITANKFIRFLTVVLFTNNLMLTGLFASVSYDNFTNLFAVMSFYYLTMFYKRKYSSTSAKFFLCIFAGCLCKLAFLPLAVLLTIAYVVRYIVFLRNSENHIQTKLLGISGIQTIVFFLIALIFFVLNLLLYGGNLTNYGALGPQAYKIVGVENALKNRIFARNYIASQYRKNKLTFDQAMSMTKIIKNEGDQMMAITLLNRARNHDKSRLMDFARFATSWLHLMLERSFNYVGHQMLVKKVWDIYPYYWVLLLSTFFFLRKANWKDADGIYFVAFMVVLIYSSFILWHINYKGYLESGVFGLATTGRYLFPVLLPICGLVTYYLINFLSEKKQLILTLLVSAWFIYGDFIFFLRVVPEYWLVRQWSL